jgi:hypothetical protein
MGLRNAEDGRSTCSGIAKGLRASVGDRTASNCRNRDARIVKHPIDDHLGCFRIKRRGIDRNTSKFPSELLLTGEVFGRVEYPDVVFLHRRSLPKS